MNKDDCLKNCAGFLSAYEVQKGIKNIGEPKILLDKPDITIVAIEKSDNSHTLRIVLKLSPLADQSWVYWCPTLSQLTALESLAPIYRIMDEKNREHRKWKLP